MVVSGAPYHAPLLAQSHARQRAVYACIVRYKREHDGNSPTVRDIGAECGITSTSIVARYLRALEAQGLIRRPWAGANCAIEVVGGVWTPPGGEP